MQADVTPDSTGNDPARGDTRSARSPLHIDASEPVGAQQKINAAGHFPAMSRVEFAEKFRPVFRTLWTIAAGIVNDPATAEDVVQEAALTALTKLNEFEPNSNFTAWMAKIVRFLALNQSRRGRKQPASVDPNSMDESMPARFSDLSDARSPIDAVGRLDAQRNPFDDRVLHALNSVSDIARSCLLLRTLQGLNYDEIARVLDIPAGTAMSHVHRTRLLLRERLADMNPTRKDIGGEHTEGGAA